MVYGIATISGHLPMGFKDPISEDTMQELLAWYDEFDKWSTLSKEDFIQKYEELFQKRCRQYRSQDKEKKYALIEAAQQAVIEDSVIYLLEKLKKKNYAAPSR